MAVESCRGFDFRLDHRYFSLTSMFLSHYGPGVDSACHRNVYQEYFLRGKGGRCVGLTFPPSCNECLEIREASNSCSPKGLSRPVQACTGIANKCHCNGAGTKPTDTSERWNWLLLSVTAIYIDDRFQLTLDGKEACWEDRFSWNDAAVQTGHLYCRSEQMNESQHRYLTKRLVGTDDILLLLLSSSSS